jgi:probable rRNA maturation factor
VGDIIIALPTVTREAAAAQRDPAAHLQHLAVHGLLHLAGYDHIDDAEADEMEALEARVLAMLGIADPYAAMDAAPDDNDTEATRR